MAQYQPTSVQQKTAYDKFANRNIPSSPLQPYLEPRPVLTKYSILPIVDPRAIINTQLIQQATYNTRQTFNPGNGGAPWSGFASNVNSESELRGQIYALQKCNQSVYVPNSSSDLYNLKWQQNNREVQPFPDLFQKQQFDAFDPNPNKNQIGYAMFNNSTRQQLKEVSDPVKKL